MAKLSAYAHSVFADECALEPIESPTVAITFDDAFRGVFERALPILRRHGLVATVFVPTGSVGRRPSWMLNRADVDDVADRGTIARADAQAIRFGSHTVSHLRLEFVDTDTVEYELTASKRSLEEIVGSPVTALALPFGSMSAQVIKAAVAAGYERVFANVPVGRRERPPLIGRVNVTPQDWPIEFALKIRGAYGWMTAAIPAKRALRDLYRRASAL
jgi:peptidoglycan/xylan/chitin deacetylase (PgdA/CDA1 family)